MKAKTYASLKRQADKVFSDWIRQSSANQYSGLNSCRTCNAVHHWKELQCGHFISRVHLATRWDERNCAPQCYACNVLRRGNPGEFSLHLIRKFGGPMILQELVDKKRESVKYSRADLIALIESYKQKLEALTT